jgi:hypothetical protein
MDLLNVLIAKSMKEENGLEADMTEEDKVLMKDDQVNQKGKAWQACKNGCFSINTFLFSCFIDT